MPRRIADTFNKQMLNLKDEWLKAGGKLPCDPNELAAWAVRNDKYHATRQSKIRQCARDLTRAFRSDRRTDPQQRKVRGLHAVRELIEGPDGKKRQRTLWDDIDTAPRDFMAKSLEQRRGQMIDSGAQIQIDQDSYNENAKPQVPIQLSFNLDTEVEMRAQSDVFIPLCDEVFSEDDRPA
jgi:hypothetical protein